MLIHWSIYVCLTTMQACAWHPMPDVTCRARNPCQIEYMTAIAAWLADHPDYELRPDSRAAMIYPSVRSEAAAP